MAFRCIATHGISCRHPKVCIMMIYPISAVAAEGANELPQWIHDMVLGGSG